MRGITKQLSLLTAVVLLVSMLVTTASAAPVEDCPGSCAHTAAIGTTHYDTLEEAIDAAESGSTVTLLADVSGQSALLIEKAIVLDLGGKILSGNNGEDEALLNVAGDFTVQNGTLTTGAGACLLVENGNLTVAKTAKLKATGDAAALILSAQDTAAMADDQDADEQWFQAKISGKLSCKGDTPAVAIGSSGKSYMDVTFGKNASVTSKDANAIEIYGGGKLTVTGGKYQAKDHVIALAIPEDETVEASITGGTFTSEKETVFIQTEEGATAPEAFITGGTYNQDPADYIASYCRILNNSDGTYTVISSYTVAFLSGGASGTMEPVKVKCGSAIKLPACDFIPAEGMDFAGWNINGKTYAVGASFTPESDVTVTAQWKEHVHYGGSATCLKKAVCTGCGETYGKLGSHKLSYSDGYAATCDSTGMNPHSKCSVCGSCFVDGTAVTPSSLSTPALGHNWESKEGKDATCTEDGLHPHRVCTVCNLIQLEGKDVEEDALVIPAAGHTMEDVAATQATCSEPGIQAHQHCTTCDGLFLKDQPVDLAALTTALSSHVLSDWQSDETYHWKACVDCGEVFRQSRHTDTDGNSSCDDCVQEVAVPETQEPVQEKGFPWYIPLLIAAAAVIVPIVKKRKQA